MREERERERERRDLLSTILVLHLVLVSGLVFIIVSVWNNKKCNASPPLT